jgi:hypothetical protein
VVSQSIEHKRKEAAVAQPPTARAEGGGVSGIDPVG